MRQAVLFVLLAFTSCLGACSAGIDHRMDCSKVLQLRLGQSPEDVQTLIGKPRFAGSQQTVWDDGTPRADSVFIYGSSQAGNTFLLGTRDEMSVHFLRGRLVEASAYRMHVYLIDHDKGSTALMLGSRDYGDHSPPLHAIGPAFMKVFNCAPDFNLDRARSAFEAADADSPNASKPQR